MLKKRERHCLSYVSIYVIVNRFLFVEQREEDKINFSSIFVTFNFYNFILF